MSLGDDISKFCKDLILGDFEQQPGNAAMVIGGLVSLIPVVDQVMDVRDVSGMIYRINRKGTKNCSKDDWVDLALAAFGCIPEVGSLFKTIIKPLWKSRKALKGALRGQAFLESMLGKGKGAAIKFMKTFNWAGNTQLALQQTMLALDLCDQLLGQLATPHWWLPADIEGLAHDLRPELKKIRGPLRTGVQEGSKALQEFVTELLGEDGYRVAQQLAGVAVGSTSGLKKPGASNKHSSSPAQQKPHKPVADKNVQDAKKKPSGHDNTTRSTKAVWAEIGKRYKALVGEHMAHYYHMAKVKAEWQQHGARTGKWLSEAKLVSEAGHEETPTELFPEHLARVNQNGVDGLWSLGNEVYHFVEAKAYESAGRLFGAGAKEIREQKEKIPPPAGMDERQMTLWFMLGQPNKGLQMSKDWLKATVRQVEMKSDATINNRWVYVFFAIPGNSKPPKEYVGLRPGATLKQGLASGILEHIEVSAEVGFRMLNGGDIYEMALHDKHKAKHEYSDIFTAAEIDSVSELFKEAKKLTPLKKAKETPKPADKKPSGGKSKRGGNA
ncbi:hypothetical protein HA050_12040 [Iodobacter sp. HSC-16F04]|uniref:Uncharacterized protein n=1 Tax=Iodobacter violaceini TaxID=3044271 RepID=A0ABX0KXS3_9NEIS|nr:hypothetical protein [Iodobacter violacea]NHQ86849.1 hypothetical protein [Iodobacter violacea]